MSESMQSDGMEEPDGSEGAGPGQHRADTGSVGDEAARLLFAAGDWFQRNIGTAQTSHIATGSPDCTWCPVCQVISIVRGDRPELTDRLAETQAAVASLLHVMTEVVSSAMPRGAGHTHAGYPGHNHPAPGGEAAPNASTPPVVPPVNSPHKGAASRGGARVQKINLEIDRTSE